MKVALVVMPLAGVHRPSLSAGLLQAAVKQRGMACQSKYFNLTLFKMLGPEAYRFLSHGAPMMPLAGEWAFARAYYGRRASAREAYQREVLECPVWGMAEEHHRYVWELEALAPVFLRVAFESCDWGQYGLVGFTSTFQQTMPSLCLARMIRERYPHVKLAAGGANFEAGMGRRYMEEFPFLDYVSTGEADVAFPQLCANLREGRDEVPPGFLYRQGGEVRASSRPEGPGYTSLDALPTPDYEDYYRVLRATSPEEEARTWMPVEASRGCWWGEHSHCTFCGLNGETMTFRRKSWRRVVEETEELARRHGPAPLQFADNILGMEYFQELLPHWAAQPEGVDKFFEIKSNLKRRQVRQLREARILHVQAGVESLADGTLKRMGKGVTGAQNVALLRWCQELGVTPYWNVLYGFPGEELADYARTLSMLEKMTHLRPPEGCDVIRMDRFSPNYTRWREHGFTRIEPAPAYRHIFPFPEEKLGELAYFFRYEQPEFEQAVARGATLQSFSRRWSQQYARGENGELAVKPHWQGGFVLVDTRFNFARASERLEEPTLALLLACDGPISRAQALQRAAGVTPGMSSGEALEQELTRLIERGFIASVGSLLITLALLPDELELGQLTRAH